MNVIGIIPARFGSTRFEGKPLINLKGKSMIQRVVEQCSKSKSLSKVIVATDDQRIYDHVKAFGGEVCMTKSTHKSGTDRCAEVVIKKDLKSDYIINIQGDEPIINPQQIDLLGEYLLKNDVEIATQARPIHAIEEINNPNVVKVVANQKQKALYFSRSAIPFERNKRIKPVLQHIGIYGFKTATLLDLVKLPASDIENTEALEQLRWLDNGYAIDLIETHFETIAIDNPADIEKVLKYLG